MPEEYKSHGPLDPERGSLPVGSTTFLAPAGNHTILGNNKPTLFANVTDGTSNTVAIVEVKPSHAVAWTSPMDYVYDKKRPSAGLYVDNEGFFLMAMADGSAHVIRNTISEEMLNFLFLMDDGNVIELPQ